MPIPMSTIPIVSQTKGPMVNAYYWAYTQTICVVFDCHDNDPSEYRFSLYRDGKLIAQSTEDSFEPFVCPSTWDHDHMTNMFFNLYHHTLLYEDKDIHKFQTYEYKVVREHYVDGRLYETAELTSLPVRAE